MASKPQMNTDIHRRCSGASVKRRSVSHRCKSVTEETAIRWVTAPQSSLPGSPAVQGVAIAPGGDVQWLWTHTPNGSYVSGYDIVRTGASRTVILSEAKNLSRSGRAGKRQRPFAVLRVTKRGAGG
jgi:hypothetical protein